MKNFRLGTSLDKTIDMGAVVDETQKKTIAQFVEDSKKEGADVCIEKDFTK